MTVCKICKVDFKKLRPLQSVCSPACALEHGRLKMAAKQSKIDKAKNKQRKDALITRPEWLKRAQVAFNSYIRYRDINQPCISCGNPLKQESLGGGYDCGHYRSVGSSPHLRYNEQNAHGQCKKCNLYLSGNIVAYRSGLIGRIGLHNVDTIEADQSTKKYAIDELKEIAIKYKDLAKKERGKHEH